MTTTVATAPEISSFARELGPLWDSVGPRCETSDERQVRALRGRLGASDGAGRGVANLAGDLDALLVGWDHFSAGQRAVLGGALAYLAEAASAQTPGEPDRPRVEAVVTAAVRTLLRSS